LIIPTRIPLSGKVTLFYSARLVYYKKSGKHSGCPKFSFQINWALQHMIKIHNSDEGASSLLKISISEKFKKKKNPWLACLRRKMK
jgi:hypothetical protein